MRPGLAWRLITYCSGRRVVPPPRKKKSSCPSPPNEIPRLRRRGGGEAAVLGAPSGGVGAPSAVLRRVRKRARRPRHPLSARCPALVLGAREHRVCRRRMCGGRAGGRAGAVSRSLLRFESPSHSIWPWSWLRALLSRRARARDSARRLDRARTCTVETARESRVSRVTFLTLEICGFHGRSRSAGITR